MEGHKGFIVLDAMIIVCWGVCLLSAFIFFHASYMNHMRRALQRIEAIEYAQMVLGYARNGEEIPRDFLPEPWKERVVELMSGEKVRWISVQVSNSDVSYSLTSVCL